ncbi:hypothetical protein [Sphingomonas sp. VNH70]|uniref:hypothetical protein n=1 Tax=Sphingomonas silueang TaxID=3156617 RepID=UPI0032B35FC0
MTRTDTHSHDDAPSGQVVRVPARSDGVGHALRRSFGHGDALPAEWQECLRQLNRISRH